MDVVGNLQHFPLRGGGGGFACAGPVPGEGEATLWACSVASGEGGVSHEVVVAGDDPASVLWVRATARGVSEEEAAGFLG